MRGLFAIILMLVCAVVLPAQTNLRIHYKNGNVTDIPISEIDSLTFVDGDDGPAGETGLVGSWLWASKEAGYFELLTFNEDKTYTGYDRYFSYGFDTQTYGYYFQNGTMLTLSSNGYGYRRRYNWFVTSLTDNALEVMTQMGRFTYYRLQPDVMHLHIGEILSAESDDSFVFTDGIVVRDEGNKLIVVETGSTYILKYVSAKDQIWGYRVVVE